MLKGLIGGFVMILIGAVLLGPISEEVNAQTISTGALNTVSSWGNTVLNLVPGFFALALMGIGIAIMYGAMRESGMV